MTLDNKVAVIIGGTKGIGQAIAERFFREGAEVFTIARSNADFTADVADYEELKKAIDAVGLKKSRIDILVNAAGIHGAIGFLPDTDVKEWESAIKTNLMGTYNAIKAAFTFLKNSKRAKIINFSGGGATSPRPMFSAYAASKAAVVNLTENLAKEFSDKNLAIDVNAVAPGTVNTRLLREAIAAGEKIKNPENFLPEKAVALCLFLASSASDGLSGKLISAVHDDWETIPNRLKEIIASDVYTLRRIKPEDRKC